MFPIAMAVLTAFATDLGPVPATVRVGEVRVGEVRVSGNVRTDNAVILGELGFCPGVRMPSEADRLRIEIRLLMKFHDRFDLAAGMRPQIVVVRSTKSEFWDVEVRFPEKE